MKFNNFMKAHVFISIALFSIITACGKNGSTTNPNSAAPIVNGANSPASYASGLANGPVLAPLSGNNVMTLTVNGSLCSPSTSVGYQNKPCVSVTICDLNKNNCTTVSDILLDTGSYGLRIFGSVISQLNGSLASALKPITSAGNPIAECVSYADGSSDWGPVEMANVVLGGEAPVQVPIQIINSSFANASSTCPGADATPTQAGFNGILGVGLFAQDCGEYCNVGNGMYFTCTSDASNATCTSFAPKLAEQVTNPVSLLPVDNNGVIVELPSIPFGGQGSANGYLVLGIGTQENNTPKNVSTFLADPLSGEFNTTFSGQNYPASFLDTGSNALYFDPPASASNSLPSCGGKSSSFQCPSSTLTLDAVTGSYDSTRSANYNFYVGNAILLSNSSNNIFMDIAGSLGDGGQSFDWGLPFYFGRNVYVGIEKAQSSLGTGPYWAY